MSRVDDLIKKLCPNGVESKNLGDVLAYEQPTKYLVKSKQYFEAAATPVLTAGQTFLLGYTNESDGIYDTEDRGPVIIFDDFTTSSQWVDFPFKVKSSAMKMLSPKNQDVSLRFVFHFMKTIKYEPQNHARQWISNYSKFKIPVPPLEIQQEIAKILDKFTQLEAELEAELEARRKQYAYYRETILECPAVSGKFVELGQLGRIVTGKTPRSKDALAWGDSLDFVTPSDISIGMKYVRSPKRRLSDEGMKSLNKSVLPADSILVTCIGADMGKTVINGDQCVTNQQINAIILNPEVNVGYLYHVLSSMRPKLLQLGSIGGGTMPILNKTSFSKVKVPLPPLAKQREVAAILDKFDALVNDISTGLPAEIAARRKQYEYYRDKLLSFEPV